MQVKLCDMTACGQSDDHICSAAATMTPFQILQVETLILHVAMLQCCSQ